LLRNAIDRQILGCFIILPLATLSNQQNPSPAAPTTEPTQPIKK
jgi:hypothetical protein